MRYEFIRLVDTCNLSSFSLKNVKFKPFENICYFDSYNRIKNSIYIHYYDNELKKRFSFIINENDLYENELIVIVKFENVDTRKINYIDIINSKETLEKKKNDNRLKDCLNVLNIFFDNLEEFLKFYRKNILPLIIQNYRENIEDKNFDFHVENVNYYKELK